MKKLALVCLLIPFMGLAQLKDIIKKTNDQAAILTKNNSSLDISAALKEALNKGVTEQVSKLTKTDGFYKNDAVKIIMPDELRKVEATLRKIGLSSLADDGIKAFNRAAEDAVKEATPVFVNAIKNINITDAKSILMGNDSAATAYLQTSTTKELYIKFSPVVQTSLEKVGANVIWTLILKKYNTLPLVRKINTDITYYVTNKSLEGVFKMITIEEKNIRTNLNSRTSDVLKKVFALQDKK